MSDADGHTGMTGPPVPQPLREALTHLASGNVRAALHAASDACHAAPDQPEPHYVYGQAWMALNEPARAEQAFAAAIQLRSGWADAWINYGIARYRQGSIEDAKIAMRQALTKAPGHPAATANLGAFMRISGESAEAEALLRATIERMPGNVGVRLNLAADLMQEERAGEALVLLDEAEPPADDRHAARHWYLQRALALLQLDRPVAARTALDAFSALGPVPAALAPLWLWRCVLLSLAEGRAEQALESAVRMEAALDAMGVEAVLEHRIMGHFDLAKFWSSRGEHRRAMAHWGAGHDLLKPSQPFSRAEHAAFIEANISFLSGARFANGARASNNDPVPVFIVGMPRSGTTLCEQILAAHRDVFAAGERSALGRAFFSFKGSDTAAAIRRIADLDGPALDRAAAQYLAELHALAPDKARVVDKMPANYLYLGLVGLMLPGARIIHCVRDPRDIGLSIFTFRFHGHHAYAHDLADLGWTIANQIRLMDHWKGALPNPILTVSLSDWVEDFGGTLEQVLSHCGLPPDPACAQFHKSESRVRTVSRVQVRQPVNARGLGRWRTHVEDLAPLIEELEAAGAFAGWDP